MAHSAIREFWESSVFFGFFRKESWVDRADYESPKLTLAIIMIAGVLGGSLADPAAVIVGAERIGDSLSWLQSVGLGFAAAGIGTMVVANTRRQDRLSLFFFALLCGISFPAVIEAAKANLVKEEAREAAAKANTDKPNQLNAVVGEAKKNVDQLKNLPSTQSIELETGLLDGVSSVTDAVTETNRNETIAAIKSAKELAQKAEFEKLEQATDRALDEIRQPDTQK